MTLGIEIDELDLSSTETEELRTLLAEHGVLILRRQPLDDAGFLAFLRRFGEMMFTEGETPVPGFPDLNVISNVGRTTPPKSTFHVDTTYVPNPPAYTALRAVEVPEAGGSTLFSDQYAAYDTLPADRKADLAGRTVTHRVTGVASDTDSCAEHPLFAVHPVTGRTALALSAPARCVAISGMSTEEAQETVRYLFEHSTRETNVLRHAWAPEDVVMWDNRCVMHKADHSGVVGNRVMHRGMIANGESPSVM
ncbi:MULTISPECIES: TauD/TfdA dioxygenase family protein [Rhodococcus]|uniref:TauD/TfdA family dioxygenase n=1 Tax=Rhodococcus cerastii TaxID=908616 RepID=A0ABU4CWJ6_9NOCA|nr:MULTISPECIES: TauD/TfdA family dioxygenase [Rhodococcus]MDV6301837.1 TauD/TfdA family dioxygenase [Rhodococcus cerastii]MDV7988981.1 TauD/TfdA family dioxygenase [Rhodococcus sp. IEGM 1374]MDV8057242.1 TauD/TfdA family dioxygenase [Rhodococcus sp. IEGM 1343]OZE38326.1 taurine catabolism dioxygenase [Rhodococcus sp. 05-2254-4]OZE47211.1 taurine catabolism dioxygenase [Rhodococcus sp. 05-2254-3]